MAPNRADSSGWYPGYRVRLVSVSCVVFAGKWANRWVLCNGRSRPYPLQVQPVVMRASSPGVAILVESFVQVASDTVCSIVKRGTAKVSIPGTLIRALVAQDALYGI